MDGTKQRTSSWSWYVKLFSVASLLSLLTSCGTVFRKTVRLLPHLDGPTVVYESDRAIMSFNRADLISEALRIDHGNQMLQGLATKLSGDGDSTIILRLYDGLQQNQRNAEAFTLFLYSYVSLLKTGRATVRNKSSGMLEKKISYKVEKGLFGSRDLVFRSQDGKMIHSEVISFGE